MPDLPIEEIEILIEYLCQLIPDEVETTKPEVDPFYGIDVDTLH